MKWNCFVSFPGITPFTQDGVKGDRLLITQEQRPAFLTVVVCPFKQLP
jgi:hypothetical protein